MEFVIWYNRSEEDERGTGERRVIRSERKQETGNDDGKFHSKKVSLEKKFSSKKVPLKKFLSNPCRMTGSFADHGMPGYEIWDIRTNRQQKAPGGRTLTH